MKKNTSVSLGSHFEAFISKEIETGRYQSASEVIRNALRLLETEQQKMTDLRNALELGEMSGIAEDFDSDKFLEELHKKHL